VGGGFPGAARRAVRYGDGWMPIAGRDDDLEEQLPAFRSMARDAGRDPSSLEVSLFGVAAKESVVERYRALGADRVVFGLPSAAADALLPMLDAAAKLARRLG
jgi:alkanesulfonate monooxygenase SsuD/methylene tetrahydromethanopterin reductase-like flavin-dependent oxidoreductase (luciferase family)